MRSLAGRATVSRMDVREQLVIDLQEAAPLCGVVRYAGQQPRPFQGWVALAAVLDACVAEARGADGRASQGPAPPATAQSC